MKLVASLLCLVVLAACGSDPEVVNIGGAPSETVERPWGTVKVFPKVEKAEPPTQVELDFVRDMIAHHEQAVVLSDLVLQHEKIDERVTATARFIALDQSKEITAMRQWLKAWKEPETTGHHSSHHDMPGMVADDKIKNLEQLGADEAPLEFVELMLFHHAGAVEMSQDFLPEGNNAFTLNIARHLIREQTLEMTYLKQLKAEL